MKTLVCILVAVALLSVGASARTWLVEKDGSGDFTVIQEAVDAASNGDVIDIGPGRFDDYELYWVDGSPAWNVYVFLKGKSLTLQGAGADQTIIGPEDEDFHPWPGRDVMIVNANESQNFVISGMTLEHSPFKIIDAYYNNGTFHMTECVIREGNSGIFGAFPLGGRISNCRFDDLDSYGVAFTDPTSSYVVEYCDFHEVHAPVAADWSPTHVDVSNCTMEDGRLGVGFYGGGSGSITNCTINNFSNYGIALSDPGVVAITDNVIEQSNGWGMVLGFAEQATISNNLISTETGTCLYLPYPCNGMVFEGNDLYRGQGNFAKTNDYWPYTPNTYFNLENNYWGTTDAVEIQSHILDGNNMENVNMFVLFEPFAGGSVPVEQKSLSQVKKLFR